MLEAIAVAYGFNPEGATLNYRFENYNDVSELSTALHITKGQKKPRSSYFFQAADGAQFIIATHSPILLGVPGAEILSFDEGEVHLCAYEETESYQVTEMFINNKDVLIRRLLE